MNQNDDDFEPSSDLDFDQNDPTANLSGSYLRTSMLVNIVDRVQLSGRPVPVFGPPSREKEEKYIQKMIERDREYEKKVK